MNLTIVAECLCNKCQDGTGAPSALGIDLKTGQWYARNVPMTATESEGRWHKITGTWRIRDFMKGWATAAGVYK